MRERYRLPKFGSASNPFAAPASAPEEETAETPSDVAPKHQRYQKSPAEFAAARLKETKKLPVDPAAGVKETSRPPARDATVRTRTGRWMDKLNPLFWFSRRREEPRSAITRFSEAPVQGELSLDRVRVVRNDLSEADVEIITARPGPKPKSLSAAPADETVELLKT
jgi:hypothetical protein